MDIELEDELRLEKPVKPVQVEIPKELSAPAPGKPLLVLRDYQDRGLNNFAKWLDEPAADRQSLMAMCPNSGATILAAACVKHSVETGGKVVWVVKDLLGLAQAQQALKDLRATDATLEQSRNKADFKNNIVITLAQSLKTDRLKQFIEDSKTGKWEPSLIVCEAGKSRFAPTKNNIIEAFPDAKVLNFTSTMTRGDVKGYLPLGRELLTYTKQDAIAKDGILVPVEKATTTVQVEEEGKLIPLSELPTAAMKQRALMDVGTIREVARAVDHEMGLHPELGGPPLKTLVFVSKNVQGAMLTEQFRAQGKYSVEEVYHTTPPRQTEKILADYRAGKIDILINNMCLKESFADPGIRMVVNLRPSMVEDLMDTCIARGQLPEAGKAKVILMDIPDQRVVSGRAADVAVGLPNEEEVEAFRMRNGGIGSTVTVFLDWFKSSDQLRTGNDPKECDSLLGLGAAGIMKAVQPSMELSLPASDYAARINSLEGLLNGKNEGVDGESVLSKSLGVPKPFTEGTGVIISKLRQAGWYYCPHEKNPDLSELPELTDNPMVFDSRFATIGSTRDKSLKSVMNEIFTKKLIRANQPSLFCQLREIDGKARFWFNPWKKEGGDLLPINDFVYVPQRPGNFCYWVKAANSSGTEDLWIFSFDRKTSPTGVKMKKVPFKAAPPRWWDKQSGKFIGNDELDIMAQRVEPRGPEGAALQKLIGIKPDELERTEIARAVGMSMVNVEQSEANRAGNGGESDLEQIARLLTEHNKKT